MFLRTFVEHQLLGLNCAAHTKLFFSAPELNQCADYRSKNKYRFSLFFFIFRVSRMLITIAPFPPFLSLSYLLYIIVFGRSICIHFLFLSIMRFISLLLCFFGCCFYRVQLRCGYSIREWCDYLWSL